MVVSYTQTLSVDMIVTEIESLLSWRARVLRPFFFANTQVTAGDAHPPSGLVSWCKKETEKGVLQRSIVDAVLRAHEVLTKSAEKVIAHCKPGVAPDLELYDAFEKDLNSFINELHHLCEASAEAAMSLDPVTHLRTLVSLRHDVKREQDRLNRKGDPFSVAHVGVDKMVEFQRNLSQRDQNSILSHVGGLLSRTLRSFDDAYHIGDGEYVIVLKHVEFLDACSVVERIRHEIEVTPAVMADNSRIRVTASFGIAEAEQHAEAEAVIANARSAFEDARHAGGNTVSEHHELSGMERYAREKDKK